MVLGLPVRTLEVKAEDYFSLRGDTLRKALEEDAQNGRKPFVLGAHVSRVFPDIISLMTR